MLDTPSPRDPAPRVDLDTRDPFDDLTIDLGAILRFVVDRIPLLIAGALIGAFIGSVWAVSQTKVYEVSSRVFYGTLRGTGAEQRTTLDPAGVGDAAIEAQVELISSDSTVNRVIDDLSLDTSASARAEFTRLSALRSFFGGGGTPLDRATLSSAILQRLSVKRIGRSPIIEISFKASDPKLAAEVANAFANAYVQGQIATNAALAAKTSEWLKVRLADLRAKAAAKDEEIRAFKTANEIEVDATGRSLESRRLADLDTDLLKAQAALTEQRGEQKRFSALAQTGVAADVSDVGDDPALRDLRQRLFAAQDRRTRLASRISPTNRLIVNLDQEIVGLQSALADRARAAAEGAARESEIIEARIRAIEAERAKVSERALASEAAAAQLSRLQSEATVIGKSFSESLALYETALRDQSYPVADARVISQAEPPSRPINASPLRTTMIMGILGALLALGGSAALVYLRTALRRNAAKSVA